MSTVEDLQADARVAADSLIAILPRVSAMNSFLRSSSYRRWHSSLHHVVYHYKREALIQATNYGIAMHRSATVPVKCRDCDGTGKFSNAWWCETPLDHCYRCGNSGHVKLKFVESTLPGAVWLTPSDKAWSFLRSSAALEETTVNWSVNQPGQDLTPSEVADHLNEIEAFFPKSPPVQRGDFSDFDIANTYTIWVGQTEPGRCYLCHSEMDRIYGGHVVHTGRVTWNGIVCKACGEHPGGLHDANDVFKWLRPLLPREFITPAIEQWIVRHPIPEPKRRDSQVVEVSHWDEGEPPF